MADTCCVLPGRNATRLTPRYLRCQSLRPRQAGRGKESDGVGVCMPHIDSCNMHSACTEKVYAFSAFVPGGYPGGGGQG